VKTIGVVRFLGTNCDTDVFKAINETEGLKAEWLWYEDRFDCKKFDGLVLPGGFSYGDYLRSGALAAKSAVMDSVEEFSKTGKPVLGICNGFQVLCERGLLPGALLKNKNLSFIDRWVSLKPVSQSSMWALEGKEYKVPVAHGDGCYYVNDKTLSELQSNDQIWLRYNNNPNGSVGDIAGVLNKEKNVAGLMPHPERALYEWMGSSDGACFFNSFLQSEGATA
jgi:phosphoribosylformylglycinamidine synthase